VPVGGLRGRGGRGAPGTAGPPAPPPAPIPPQEASQVSATWPAGPGEARMAPYMLQAQQQWTIAPLANAGGYPGSPYFKITIAGTDRTLAATTDRELAVLPAFTGAPEQLWRIDQLADGTYRVMPKAVPNSKEPLALSAVGSSMPTLTTFDPQSDRQRWHMRTP